MKAVRRANRFEGVVAQSARGARWMVAVMGLTLCGCWGRGYNESGVAGLKRFTSAEEFKAYLADQVDAIQYWRGGGGLPVITFLGGPMAQSDMSAVPSAGEATGEGFSTTNVQEEGVDESDVVKNDAEYLYVLAGNQLRIVRAVPANSMEVTASVALSGTPFELFLLGDTVVALSNDYVSDGPVTRVTIVDVTDRNAPTTPFTADAPGQLLTSRMIGSILHLVVQSWPTLPPDPGILLADVHSLIPDLTMTPANGAPSARDVVEWSDFYHPIDPDGYSMTAVVSLDVLKPDEPVRSIGVMADAGSVYASPAALYLTDQNYNYAGQFRETTDIYKFDLSGTQATVAAVGSVPGRVLNRFSMGEHEGYLRVATTTSPSWEPSGSPSVNSVYVLGQENGELPVAGQIEGLAPGEQIFSARFLGDRGFLVTFKNIDPLFTLDLSDPANPQMVGTLKVPGYSDYIHPLGPNHLLTIGKDAVDMGDFAWYQGVQLSIFDVTDFAHPTRVDAEIIGDRGTESEALHNPHAFNYYSPAGVLAVPMLIAEGANPNDPSSFGTPTFVGVCVFDIDAQAGITTAGQVSTGQPGYYDIWGFQNWSRGIFIGEFVYVVTDSKVLAVPKTDLDAQPYQLGL